MLTGAEGLAVVATKPLVKPEMTRELFIILVEEKGSQGWGCGRSGSILTFTRCHPEEAESFAARRALDEGPMHSGR